MYNKKNIGLKLLILLIINTFVFTVSAFGTPVVMPTPKQMNLRGKEVSLQSVVLKIDDVIRQKYPSAINALRTILKEDSKGITIRIKVYAPEADKNLPQNVRNVLMRPESYWLEVSKDRVVVIGSDILGTLYGITTLEQIVKQGNKKIPQGSILDWPDHKTRVLHVVLRNVAEDTVRQLIVEARMAKMNTIIMLLADGVCLESLKRVANKNALSTAKFLDVVHFAEQNGLEVIPEIKCLTHQEKFLKNAYPHVMYNASTYDPRKEDTYKIVLSIIDEIIALLHPRAILIGHDEVAGATPKTEKEWLKEGETMLPPSLFLQDTERLFVELKKRGVETWMWGDMLISPEDSPSMFYKHLHGLQGYSKIRDKIPKDIVICDWHYFDNQVGFPSSMLFAKLGHKVLGATWKKEKTIRNFSKYVASMQVNGQGMIATTWIHVQKKEWDILNTIIQVSGDAFWNAK